MVTVPLPEVELPITTLLGETVPVSIVLRKLFASLSVPVPPLIPMLVEAV